MVVAQDGRERLLFGRLKRCRGACTEKRGYGTRISARQLSLAAISTDWCSPLLTAESAISFEAAVQHHSRCDDKEHHPCELNTQSLGQFPTSDLSQKHRGWEVGEVLKREHIDYQPPRFREHVQRKHVT